MAQPRQRKSKGLNHNVFNTARESMDRSEYLMLKDFIKELGPFAINAREPSVQSLVGENFTTRQQILVDAGRPLLRDRMSELQAIACTDQESAIYMLAALNDRPRDTADPYKRRDMLHRSAVLAASRNKTERTARWLGLIHQSPHFSRNFFGVFEEFFDICQTPNPAEVELLSRLGGSTPRTIENWFHVKRRAMGPLFAARTAIRRTGPVGKWLKLQRYTKERKPRSQKKAFTDH